MDLLRYYPFTSSVNPSFWHKLTELKLDVDKLDDSKRRIWGFYSNLTLCESLTNSLFEIDSTSFNTEWTGQNIYAPGVILNKNTIEQFKDCDKAELIQEESKVIWEYIKSGKATTNPSLLNFFIILSFADLKKYNYYYWFCFPTPSRIASHLEKVTSIKDVFSEILIEKLCHDYNGLDVSQKPYFLIKSSTKPEIMPLNLIKTIEYPEDYYFAFSDPSTSSHPGWVARNFLCLIVYNCPFLIGKSINLLGFRLKRFKNIVSCSESLIFKITLPNITIKEISSPENTWFGWEKNERGKFGPRLANMRNSIDPKCLAETAVDLNLKLMKWQLLPNIDLEKIKNSKCLLLGSGTLGCSVARTLLGWGCLHISFVDNGVVSFSNPVRQSLFMYEDCLKNNNKAEVASKNLRKIFPGVTSLGHCLSIPMPGHPVGTSFLSQTKESVEKLSKLISQHDVIFLLMDSRESRWLPTLLSSYFNKIVINAALGFDTYLVMRHGFRTLDVSESTSECLPGLKSIPGRKLGCYFCNDVTAPGNSLKDRTLDQQCTVTRPGVSAIAGALAVELAVSILQHPDGANAKAFYKVGRDTGDVEVEEGILGILPHSIRGFLSNYTHVLPATEKYTQCVACSEIVLEEYEKNGFEFLLKVFDSSKYLEELTGLSGIQNGITDLEVWDLEESDGSE